MYELNEKQTAMVAGGALVYVTEEWKSDGAQNSGYIWSAVGILTGGFMGYAVGTELLVGSSIAIPVLVGMSIGAACGYATGYALSVMENYSLENNAWYDISVY